MPFRSAARRDFLRCAAMERENESGMRDGYESAMDFIVNGYRIRCKYHLRLRLPRRHELRSPGLRKIPHLLAAPRALRRLGRSHTIAQPHHCLPIGIARETGFSPRAHRLLPSIIHFRF
jgi:hypothetical protein